jgi:hypothetical protein
MCPVKARGPARLFLGSTSAAMRHQAIAIGRRGGAGTAMVWRVGGSSLLFCAAGDGIEITGGESFAAFLFGFMGVRLRGAHLRRFGDA